MGPLAGIVDLPMHVAWSGRRVYDVGEENQRLVLYALLWPRHSGITPYVTGPGLWAARGEALGR